MIKEPKLFLVKSGIAIGLLIGLLDSIIHFVNLESYKPISIILFVLLFAGIYWSVMYYRDKFVNKIISFGTAFKQTIIVGFIAAFLIAVIRFIFLKLTNSDDLMGALNQTRELMLSQPQIYSQEEVSNRLSFIEFTYNPFISSLLYFTYYIVFVVIFAVIASFFIKRIDRNISF